MHDERVSNLSRAALMAAVCLVLTRVVVIPAPTGYVNLGDCGVLLSGWLLGPLYGGVAAGIGVMLADVLSGFAVYAPGSFGIKFAMAVAANLVYRGLKDRNVLVACGVSSVLAEGIMTAGYFAYERIVLGYGVAAAAAIPANLIQGALCAAAGIALMQGLAKNKGLFIR